MPDQTVDIVWPLGWTEYHRLTVTSIMSTVAGRGGTPAVGGTGGSPVGAYHADVDSTDTGETGSGETGSGEPVGPAVPRPMRRLAVPLVFVVTFAILGGVALAIRAIGGGAAAGTPPSRAAAVA